MTGEDGIDEVVLNLNRHFFGRRWHLLDDDLDALWLYKLELVIEGFAPISSHLLDCSNILLGQRQHGLSLEGNGVTHIATPPASQSSFCLTDSLTNYLHQQLVGIASSFVNLQSAVSTTQVLHSDTYSSIFRIGVHFLIVQCSGDVDAACRANDKLSPMLGVEVQENVALQLTFRQIVGTVHASFFVTGNQCVNRTVLQRPVLHNGHNGGHTQAIVSTEGCALGLHPFSVNPRLDRVGFKIMGAFWCLLRHHVHVSLQDDALAVFHTR